MKTAVARGWGASVNGKWPRLLSVFWPFKATAEIFVGCSRGRRVRRVVLVPLREYRRLARIDKLIGRLGGLELLRLAEQATKHNQPKGE